MAWYDINYACRHSGREQIYGKYSYREWLIAKKSEEICPECWEEVLEKKHKEEAEKARKLAQEYGLPSLEGTEKQVHWAETIRRQKIDEIQTAIDGIEEIDDNHKKAKLELTELFQRVMAKSSAAWWIDNRSGGAKYFLQKAEREKKAEEEAALVVEHLNQIEIETTLRPENPVTEAVAVIALSDSDDIRIEFPEKRDDFRAVVKQYGYRYDYCWHRGGGPNPLDRAAEIGQAFLAANFIIRIPEQKIREKVISGQFEREHTRMIWRRGSGKYKGWFAIEWRRNEDYYEVARKLPRSRYGKPFVVVPQEYFDEVLDFARMYDFKLSPGAEEIVKEQQGKKEKILVVRVEKPEPVAAGKKASGKIPQLEVPENVEIDEGLRDND